MIEFRCWRCNRGLNIERAPEREDMIVRCGRCQASNVVRKGVIPSEPLDTPPREAAQLRATTA